LRARAAALALALALEGCSQHDVVDYAKFRSIPPGATYQWVVGVVGSPGRVYQASEIIEGGIIAKPGETTYVWTNKDGSHATIAFRNGRVSGMSEWGL
jgi:hypothetical protein